MNVNEFYVVARWSDGSVSRESIQLLMRCAGTPVEVGWFKTPQGWRRVATVAVVEGYLARVAQRRQELDGLTLLGWRALSPSENEMFNRDREYRNAMEDVGGRIQHNMVKARECHRERLRHINGDRFMGLDREWVNASAAGDSVAADAVEAQRKALRDLVDDPRIDAAQSLDELKLIVPPEDA